MTPRWPDGRIRRLPFGFSLPCSVFSAPAILLHYTAAEKSALFAGLTLNELKIVEGFTHDRHFCPAKWCSTKAK